MMKWTVVYFNHLNDISVDYIKPEDVPCPGDAKVKVKVIFPGDENTVAMAEITCRDRKYVGIRWNVALGEWDDPEKCAGTKKCVGMPVSHGIPVWFILPNDFFDSTSEISTSVLNSLGLKGT